MNGRGGECVIKGSSDNVKLRYSIQLSIMIVIVAFSSSLIVYASKDIPNANISTTVQLK